jgi:hypothetical protein
MKGKALALRVCRHLSEKVAPTGHCHWHRDGPTSTVTVTDTGSAGGGACGVRTGRCLRRDHLSYKKYDKLSCYDQWASFHCEPDSVESSSHLSRVTRAPARRGRQPGALSDLFEEAEDVPPAEADERHVSRNRVLCTCPDYRPLRVRG